MRQVALCTKLLARGRLRNQPYRHCIYAQTQNLRCLTSPQTLNLASSSILTAFIMYFDLLKVNSKVLVWLSTFLCTSVLIAQHQAVGWLDRWKILWIIRTDTSGNMSLKIPYLRILVHCFFIFFLHELWNFCSKQLFKIFSSCVAIGLLASMIFNSAIETFFKRLHNSSSNTLVFSTIFSVKMLRYVALGQINKCKHEWVASSFPQNP